MSNIIEMRSVTKRRGDFVLQDIDLSLPAGYVCGFVGPNGAGKSTTIQLLLGLLRRDAGDIELFGRDIDRDALAIKQDIGFVLEDACFHESLNATQVGWTMAGLYRRWDDAAYRAYLERFALPPKKPIKAYSTGMRAKLSMAVALSHHAKLLVLDEPTSGLDPIVRDDILTELFDAVRDPECGVFFSSHITSDLDKVADHIVFIRHGRIELSVTKDDVDENYAIVKAPKKLLPDMKELLLGSREGEYGFEALTSHALDVRRRYGERAVVEKARIEDIMLFLERGASA